MDSLDEAEVLGDDHYTAAKSIVDELEEFAGAAPLGMGDDIADLRFNPKLMVDSVKEGTNSFTLIPELEYKQITEAVEECLDTRAMKDFEAVAHDAIIGAP